MVKLAPFGVTTLNFDISCSRFDISVLVMAATCRRCLPIDFSHVPGCLGRTAARGRVILPTAHNETLKLALYLVATHSANRGLSTIPGDVLVKLTNLTITPKLGILVGVTLFGLCAAGALAGYLMQREMLNARI